MRRIRLPDPNKPAQADPTFCRLIAELHLVRVVGQQVKRGITRPEQVHNLASLERSTWTALNQYITATAFVAEIDGVIEATAD